MTRRCSSRTNKSHHHRKVSGRNGRVPNARVIDNQRGEKKCILKKQLLGGAKETGTGHLTIDAKRSKMRVFYRYLKSLPDRISDVTDIKAEHIAGFIGGRRESGKSHRTLQNDMAAIRTVLRHHRCNDLADHGDISCRALGISNASRAGTKVAATEEKYLAALNIAQSIAPCLAACLRLERTIGLRGMEAIRSGKSLLLWRDQLARGEPLDVVHGTKGGRRRDVRIPDPAAATEAVDFAIEVLQSNGGTLLPNNLKKAFTFYRHKMNLNVELQGHSLRYAFTLDRVEAYLAQGLTLIEALSRAAEDLGHGSGRGRWVKHVYLNKVNLSAPMRINHEH